MNPEQLEQLRARNQRIIDAIIAKAQRECPDSIALIGIYGSFYSGDIHPRSDLDLCVLINDERGYNVSHCFILGEVAHDIYCTTWQQLERQAEYADPYVTKLMDLNIVYSHDDASLQRYLELRNKLSAKLNSPLEQSDLAAIRGNLDTASLRYADLSLSNELGEARYAAAEMLYSLELAIYMLNKRYVARSLRRIPHELASMEHLPTDFIQQHQSLVQANSLSAIKRHAAQLLKSVKAFYRQIEQSLRSKPEIKADHLRGSYEEIFSNWKNKMRLATETNDPYLALMTTASCQNFYHHMHNSYAIPAIDLMANFDSEDLAACERAFNTAMEEYRTLYDATRLSVTHYDSLEAFERGYLAS
jgi:hypothetical protein